MSSIFSRPAARVAVSTPPPTKAIAKPKAAPVVSVSTEPEKRKDRHRPGYMAEYMRKRRAAGKA